MRFYAQMHCHAICVCEWVISYVIQAGIARDSSEKFAAVIKSSVPYYQRRTTMYNQNQGGGYVCIS